MNINATLLGTIFIFFALTMGVVCYYLGRRKTKTPLFAGLLGVVLSFFPLFAFIYVIVLLMKKDLVSSSGAVSG